MIGRCIASVMALGAALVLQAGQQLAAQQAQTGTTLTPVPTARSMPVPAAKLMRVDDGVFEMKIGQSIDLTNRKVFLAIPMQQNGNDLQNNRLTITLNGQTATGGTGTRFDLKTSYATRDVVKDKDNCFLDVVDLLIPKGAPLSATFRLNCL